MLLLALNNTKNYKSLGSNHIRRLLACNRHTCPMLLPNLTITAGLDAFIPNISTNKENNTSPPLIPEQYGGEVLFSLFVEIIGINASVLKLLKCAVTPASERLF